MDKTLFSEDCTEIWDGYNESETHKEILNFTCQTVTSWALSIYKTLLSLTFIWSACDCIINDVWLLQEKHPQPNEVWNKVMRLYDLIGRQSGKMSRWLTPTALQRVCSPAPFSKIQAIDNLNLLPQHTRSGENGWIRRYDYQPYIYSSQMRRIISRPFWHIFLTLLSMWLIKTHTIL